MKDTLVKPLPRYWAPFGGLPGQHELLSGRAVFTEAYAFIPRGVMTDIVTSALPFWEQTRAWIIARPMSGFAETFSQYIMEVLPGGGSDRPEPDPEAEACLFLLQGGLDVVIAGVEHHLEPGGFAFIPAGTAWTTRNNEDEAARFHWIRKAYEPVEGLGLPDPIIGNERSIKNAPMPDTDGRWTTTRFFDHDDMRMDMHVTIVNLMPGAEIPFTETHVMEHGLYVLEGKGIYKLNRDWIEVEAGDFMWLRAFCPQGCYAGGPGRFRYLLYKDVNRHPRLNPRGHGAAVNETIRAEALTAETFAAFGDVIEASGPPSFQINGGMCDRFHDLARTDFGGPGGRANISVGYGRPYALPLSVRMVERHPLGSQAFVPMTEDPFLVIVAPDEDGSPGRPRAFLTRSGQGVNYLRNTWHGVLTPSRARIELSYR